MKNESKWVEITREGSSKEGILTITKAMQTDTGAIIRVEVKLWGKDSVISISNSLTFVPNGVLRQDEKENYYLV